MKLFDDPTRRSTSGRCARPGLGATAFIPGEPDTWEGWEDSAVPPERLGEYLRDLRKLADEYGYDSALYGHFGQGCVHTRIDFDLVTKPGIAKFRRFLEEAGDLVVELRRLDLGRARRRPVEGRAPAEDVRRRARRGLRRVQGDLGPRLEDEPGQGRRPVPRRREPPARRRLRARRRSRRTSSYPTTTASFAHATVRCVGVGECRDARAAATHVPELHGRRARRCTRPAAARTCSSRCSRARRSPTAGRRTR